MTAITGILARKVESLALPLAVMLPGGSRIGAKDASVTVRIHDLGSLAHIATGQLGKIGQDYVDGRIDLDGRMRDVMAIGVELMGHDPSDAAPVIAPLAWVGELMRLARSRAHHKPQRDAKQIQFHYDVSDEFYSLWLDPKRLYSCAYFHDVDMTIAAAQEAKLEHICKKLMLKPGERFLDVGAGWGGLLLWAAEHHGVRGQGITLSRNQHAHVNRLIEEKGLGGRVSMQLLDYRDMPEHETFDKIASVGMFEHVGRAQLPAYFEKIDRLLTPGGLLLNHGITSGGTHNTKLGNGLGDFMEKNIFPGGELAHVSHVLKVMSEAKLEAVDVESLRPHYAKTLWAWSDALEAQLDAATRVARPETIRAYRVYLAGSALCFERAWISLYQMLGASRTGAVTDGPMRGAQSVYPFQRDYMYPPPPAR